MRKCEWSHCVPKRKIWRTFEPCVAEANIGMGTPKPFCIADVHDVAAWVNCWEKISRRKDYITQVYDGSGTNIKLFRISEKIAPSDIVQTDDDVSRSGTRPWLAPTRLNPKESINKTAQVSLRRRMSPLVLAWRGETRWILRRGWRQQFSQLWFGGKLSWGRRSLYVCPSVWRANFFIMSQKHVQPIVFTRVWYDTGYFGRLWFSTRLDEDWYRKQSKLW